VSCFSMISVQSIPDSLKIKWYKINLYIVKEELRYLYKLHDSIYLHFSNEIMYVFLEQAITDIFTFCKLLYKLSLLDKEK
jgi:hypothetical protein